MMWSIGINDINTITGSISKNPCFIVYMTASPEETRQ